MSKINITIDCEQAVINPKGFNGNTRLELDITNASGIDFDNVEVAKCVSINTFIESRGGLGAFVHSMNKELDTSVHYIINKK